MACGEMKKCSAFLNYSFSITENIIRKTVLKRNSKKESPIRKMSKLLALLNFMFIKFP